ncbi:hypothetical protein BDP81DRAFT_169986 [Colletotrichum phormii]|nr:uncharacterized protein BDP81DRAFT_169986 [Colletotrichum phormii]KAK1621862.1 hypothetical protein BDP81DRAFT_169986 [Colletotrichum phormii]
MLSPSLFKLPRTSKYHHKSHLYESQLRDDYHVRSNSHCKMSESPTTASRNQRDPGSPTITGIPSILTVLREPESFSTIDDRRGQQYRQQSPETASKLARETLISMCKTIGLVGAQLNNGTNDSDFQLRQLIHLARNITKRLDSPEPNGQNGHAGPPRMD